MGDNISIVMPEIVPEQQAITSNNSVLPPWYVSISLLCWMVSLFHYIEGYEYMKYFGLVAVVLCLPKIFLTGIIRIWKMKSLDINMLMSLAAIGAIVINDYSESAAVVSVFASSSWLLKKSTSRVRMEMS